jgi:hypothetical protein
MALMKMLKRMLIRAKLKMKKWRMTKMAKNQTINSKNKRPVKGLNRMSNHI